MFAGDTVLEGVMDTWLCSMQKDLDRLEKLANRNLMKFSRGKCKTLHVGTSNSMYSSILGSDQLESSLVEKCL